MRRFRNKTAGILTSLAVVLQVFLLPGAAYADVSGTIYGNGSESDNDLTITTERTTTVSQSNNLDLDTDVDIDANTGDNSASGNTNGSVSIETGSIDTDVSLNTLANRNVANVVSPGFGGDTQFEIRYNGTESDNTIDFDQAETVDIDQTNNADIDHDVRVDANTGDNDAEDNTLGDVSVETGDIRVLSGVEVNTTVNDNHALVGGTGSANGELSASILGNGSESDNLIDIVVANDVDIDQSNNADVDVDVDVDADTGDNDANDNTLSEILVSTGAIDVDVLVNTLANFNGAHVWDGYVGDIALAEAVNGTESDNNIDFDLSDLLDLDQSNNADVDYEDLDVDADTGDNEADDNTLGGVEIVTSAVDSSVEANTTGNVNQFGTGLFEGWDDVEFEMNFSYLSLWAGLFASL